jgi:hypothetical protein
MFDVASMLVNNSVGLSSDIQHVFKLCAPEFNWLKILSSVPFSARSKAYVHDRSPAGIVSSNPTGRMNVCLLSVACRQVEVSVTK